MKVAVLMHLFYHDLWYELGGYVGNLRMPFDVYANLVRGNFFNWRQSWRIKKRFPGASVQVSENRGRDIGGFLRLIDTVLKSGKRYDALILVHSKKSPGADPRKGVNWRADLMSSILGCPVRAESVARAFANDPQLGMVGSHNYLMNLDNRPDFALYRNGPYIDEYCRRFGLKPDRSDFIAGTMFWVRAEPFLGFFARHNPRALAAELEAGDAQDDRGPTRTHSWERLFGYIITCQGYSIRGVVPKHLGII